MLAGCVLDTAPWLLLAVSVVLVILAVSVVLVVLAVAVVLVVLAVAVVLVVLAVAVVLVVLAVVVMVERVVTVVGTSALVTADEFGYTMRERCNTNVGVYKQHKTIASLQIKHTLIIVVIKGYDGKKGRINIQLKETTC